MATFFVKGERIHKNNAGLGSFQALIDVEEPINSVSIYTTITKTLELKEGEYILELITKLN